LSLIVFEETDLQLQELGFFLNKNNYLIILIIFFFFWLRFV
jgi:hypothetical protein